MQQAIKLGEVKEPSHFCKEEEDSDYDDGFEPMPDTPEESEEDKESNKGSGPNYKPTAFDGLKAKAVEFLLPHALKFGMEA
jgi:hypothetical protein